MCIELTIPLQVVGMGEFPIRSTLGGFNYSQQVSRRLGGP